MQKLAKNIVVRLLGWQVRRLYKKNNFKVVAVAGSTGKTSTKFAIARLLSQKYKVLFQEGNYNDIVSVPLVFFGQDIPSLFNPFAWLALLISNEKIIRGAYPFEVVILELGTDGPGQLEQFKLYLHADIGVVTAITSEHMEFFTDINAVANEELAIAQFCDKVGLNADMIEPKYYRDMHQSSVTYGVVKTADVQIKDVKFDDFKSTFDIFNNGKLLLRAQHELMTEPLLQSISAATAIAIEFGLSPSQIEAGIHSVTPVKGRMQKLNGLNGSVIIDDTYNASPAAMRAALTTLYRLKSPRKIAILGNMNELGKYSESEHRAIGEFCDPSQLELVVTIGLDANNYLAQAAEAKGCKVARCESPYAAAELIKTNLKPGSIVLVKGSQNGVFAEEAVKLLLINSQDRDKLVRQSPDWLKIKSKAFEGIKI